MTKERLSDSAVRNVRAWASARPDMSGSAAIVDAIDELLELRERLTKINDNWPDVMAVERLTAENARLMHDIEAGNAEIERLCKLHGPSVEPSREPIIPFVHWSKDPLVPYPGCACASCSSLNRT